VPEVFLLIVGAALWVIVVVFFICLCQAERKLDAEAREWDAEASSRQFVRKTWQP
jgi:hypothetical protein